ncbi:hypothetical protein HU200_065367 [Digitaria exilis]|uniref:Uncharacterized protein n=1 Tax=Digitaria exilis TaxID=1010633 RepID=A0A835DXJ4_9POAL|nr:hypothetical protein HU200_065367 [Digitaria exilis]
MHRAIDHQYGMEAVNKFLPSNLIKCRNNFYDCLNGIVLEKINNPHYLYRMTTLQAISLLAPVMGADITCQQLLPVVITSSKDRRVVEKTVKPCLVELSEDPDVDVRYYANQALQACDQMVMSS